MNKETKIYKLYLKLLGKYGAPKDFWKNWCKEKKTTKDREKIAFGAILTQRVSWLNVEKALANLKKENVLSVEGIYCLGKNDINNLEKLLRPSGFYKQKAKKIFQFCNFIIKNHSGLENFLNQDLKICREQLLTLRGIGPETADSILLYAGDKPVFVIDEYTRRFVKKYNITKEFCYDYLQNLFQQNLPRDAKVYQNFHAMIVLDGKGTDWDLVSKFNLQKLI